MRSEKVNGERREELKDKAEEDWQQRGPKVDALNMIINMKLKCEKRKEVDILYV